MSGEDCAIKHQVWRSCKQRLVLVARRLPLRAVRDDDPTSPPGGRCAHLDGGGKSSASAPEQPAALDRGDQLVALTCVGHGQWPQGGEVLLEADRMVFPPGRGHPRERDAIHQLVRP